MRNLLRYTALVAVVALIAVVISMPHAAYADDGIRLSPLVGIGMAVNVMGNYNETFFAQEALIQLEKVMGMANRVHRGYNADTKTKGNSIEVRRPSTFVATDAPASDSALNTESVTILLDKHKEVKFAITDKDLSLTSDRIISDHIRPAAVALADLIDQDLAALYKGIPWYSVLTATPTLGDIGAIAKIMFDNKVPMNDESLLHFMIGGAEKLAFQNALAASGMQPNQQDGALRHGSLGRLFGFDTWANQNTPSHTSGVAADAVGAVDFGSGTTAVYAAGLSAMHIDSITSGATLKEGDSFAITGDPQRYVLTANAVESSGDADIVFAPALKQAVDENTVVTFFLGGASKKQNIAFHTNFACLAMAPLSTLGGDLGGAKISVQSDPITQISLRARMFYMPDDSKVKVALDVLYGVKLLDPNLAVRAYQA